MNDRKYHWFVFDLSQIGGLKLPLLERGVFKSDNDVIIFDDIVNFEEDYGFHYRHYFYAGYSTEAEFNCKYDNLRFFKLEKH